MYFLKHADEQVTVSADLPEHTNTLGDSMCSCEANGVEDQLAVNAENLEEMADWLASDEAAFWMSL